MAATTAPAQLPDLSDHTCPDAETLDVGAIVVCLAWQVEDVENAPGDPSALLTSSCWPQQWRTVYGPGEDKWTPLFGANSPRYGWSEVVLENQQTLDMSIGFNWNDVGVKLKKSQAATAGSSVAANDGESVAKYQLIEWKPFEHQYCGWDWNWHTWEEGYRPRDYTPSADGLVRWDYGNLEGADLATDADNSLVPSQTKFSVDNTIGLNLRYVTPEIHGCFYPTAKEWFGEEAVYAVEASMMFGGVLQIGATKSESEASTFRYEFTTDDCYYIDPIGDQTFLGGWAFQFDEDGRDDAEGAECSGKSLFSGVASCAEEPCTGHLPSEGTAQAVYCEVLPGCDDLEGPLSCEAPQDCGAQDDFGEPCIPGFPACPPSAVALPVESCNPCDAVKTPLAQCAVPRPSCEDAGLDCPPVQRPCSDYAPGLSGEVARWVCEADAPDPCEVEGLNQLEAVFHCGDDAAGG